MGKEGQHFVVFSIIATSYGTVNKYFRTTARKFLVNETVGGQKNTRSARKQIKIVVVD